MAPRTLFIKYDGTFYESRIPIGAIPDFENEWDSFKIIKMKSKEIILDALRDMYRPSLLVRYHHEHIEDFAHRNAANPDEQED